MKPETKNKKPETKNQKQVFFIRHDILLKELIKFQLLQMLSLFSSHDFTIFNYSSI